MHERKKRNACIRRNKTMDYSQRCNRLDMVKDGSDSGFLPFHLQIRSLHESHVDVVSTVMENGVKRRRRRKKVA